MDLDSDLARSLRENHKANTEAEKVLPDRRAELDDEIDDYLDKSENGDEEAWWRLNWVLQFDDVGQGMANADFEADLTVFSGWRAATAERRERIAAAAHRAIEGSPPDIDTWFGVNTINRPAAAGYRALHLITLLHDGSTREIPPDAWTRWMPIVVDVPRFDSTKKRLHDDLLRVAALIDPDAFTAWSIRKIDAEEAKDEGHLWFVRRLEGNAPQGFLDALVERISRPQIRPVSITDLLVFLLAEEPEATIRAVRPRLTAAQSSDLPEEEEGARGADSRRLAGRRSCGCVAGGLNSLRRQPRTRKRVLCRGHRPRKGLDRDDDARRSPRGVHDQGVPRVSGIE